MTNYRKPVPKSQVELSQETITPYIEKGKGDLPGKQNRGYYRSVKDDDVKQFSIGLRDIDETITYYFNNVIKPSVIQNSKRIPVPILYGSPERWKSVQKDGYYRDKNGKIQTPLIMFKRDSIEKNRNLGNKLDANNPLNFGVFEKNYSKKNKYDKFDVLNNRIPVRELYGVIIPDYVNITYSCIVFTEYVEQMNKIVESINFASDSYWGDPEKFKFRATIDTYTTNTELNKGEDRTVKTSFQIKLLGHIVSDAINTSKANMNKYYSKAAVNFNFETAGTVEVLNARASTPEKDAQNRFFDQPSGTSSGGVNSIDREYILTNSSAIADTVQGSLATFNNKTILTLPKDLDESAAIFNVFVNKTLIPKEQRIVTQQGTDIEVLLDVGKIGYSLDSNDEVVLIGKFK